MSISYQIVEKGCFLINDHQENRIKKRMALFLTEKGRREGLPGRLSCAFTVSKKQYEGFPVYRIMRRSCQKSERTTVLFLAGGGGMARPMFFHFDVIARLVRKTNAVFYLAYYPLAPDYTVTDALEWLHGVYGRLTGNQSGICQLR